MRHCHREGHHAKLNSRAEFAAGLRSSFIPSLARRGVPDAISNTNFSHAYRLGRRHSRTGSVILANDQAPADRAEGVRWHSRSITIRASSSAGRPRSSSFRADWPDSVGQNVSRKFCREKHPPAHKKPLLPQFQEGCLVRSGCNVNSSERSAERAAEAKLRIACGCLPFRLECYCSRMPATIFPIGPSLSPLNCKAGRATVFRRATA